VHFAFGGTHTVALLPTGTTTPNPTVIQPGGLYPAQNDAAGNPYWWGGMVPQLGFNPLVIMPSASATFDGTTQVNSGLPQSLPFSYDVTFTAPGTYTLVCELHPFMKGTVTVAPTGTNIPSSARQDKRGARQMHRAAKQAIKLDRVLTKATDNHHGRHHHHSRKPAWGSKSANVVAGDGTKSFSLLGFYPKNLTVRAGSSVTWHWLGDNEIHTVTIGPDSVLEELDEALIGPPPSFILDPEGALPTDPPGGPTPVHNPTSHGEGLTGSGVISDNPGGTPNTFTATFDTPGTYHYVCLIHDGMEGWVTVLPAKHHD
jgi:plastocyanin